jgi:hypothetical protein
MTKLSDIKRAAQALTPKQLLKLDAWLHELMAVESKKRDGVGAKRQVLKEHKAVNKHYQLEWIRCGKKNCHCAEGKLHGPYWYAYWTEGGRTKSEYVGKNLPRGMRKA